MLGYVDSENFADTEYHNIFLRAIKEEIGRNSKAPFVRNFRENYETVDIRTMGFPKKLERVVVSVVGCILVAKIPKTPNNPWNIRNTYTISSIKRKTTLQNTVLIIEFE